ncbi:hypothetical protein D9M73_206920 [compost metagenome]
MAFDDVPDRRVQRRHVAALHPGAAARIEHRLEFLRDEGHIGGAPEYRRDHPREPDAPRIMLGVLRVDEDLERATDAAGFDIVDRHIDCVCALGPFELVGRARQRLRAWHQRAFVERHTLRLR